MQENAAPGPAETARRATLLEPLSRLRNLADAWWTSADGQAEQDAAHELAEAVRAATDEHSGYFLAIPFGWGLRATAPEQGRAYAALALALTGQRVDDLFADELAEAIPHVLPEVASALWALADDLGVSDLWEQAMRLHEEQR